MQRLVSCQEERQHKMFRVDRYKCMEIPLAHLQMNYSVSVYLFLLTVQYAVPYTI